MTVIYYLLIVFERGKYNVLYHLWIGSFHEYIFTVILPSKYRDDEHQKSIELMTMNTANCKSRETVNFASQSVADPHTERTQNNNNNEAGSYHQNKGNDEPKEYLSPQLEAKGHREETSPLDQHDPLLLTVSNGMNPMDPMNSHKFQRDVHLNDDQKALSDDELDDGRATETEQDPESTVSKISIPKPRKRRQRSYGYTQAVDMDVDDGSTEEEDYDGDGGVIPHTESMVDIMAKKRVELEVETLPFMEFWDQIGYDYHGWCRCCHCCRTPYTLCDGEFWYFDDWDCSKEHVKDCSAWICKRALFWIFTVITFSLMLILLQNRSSRTVTLRISDDDDDDDGDGRQYPICSMSLDLELDLDLSVVDFVYIAAMTYSDASNVESDWNRWFGAFDDDGNTTWTLRDLHYDSDPTFFHLESDPDGLDIVAIQGPEETKDAVMDLSLWTEVYTLQMLSLVVPLTNILPDGFLRWFIDFTSFPEDLIAPDIRAMYDDPVYDYVVEQILNDSNRNDSDLILVGHSLGAALAQIVGGRLYQDGYGNMGTVHSFALSSPGTLFSAHKFGFVEEDVDDSAIALVPRADWVPMIGGQGGATQMIQCTEPTAKCHRSVNSMCELYSKCDAELFRNRTFMDCLCTEKFEWTQCAV